MEDGRGGDEGGGAGAEIALHVASPPSAREAPTEASLAQSAPSGAPPFKPVHIVGLTCAYDFSATILNIQAYFTLVGGEGHLYGLIIGAYDIAQILVAPLVGVACRKYGYKTFFLACLTLLIIGNIIYSLVLLVHHLGSHNAWLHMLVARLVMGAGSAGIIAGTAFITEHSSLEQRTEVLGDFRVMQALARMFGPMFTLFFVDFTDNLGPDAGIGSILFNFYTIPSWFAALCGFEAFVYFAYVFDEATYTAWAAHLRTTARPAKATRHPQLGEAMASAFAIKIVWGMLVWAFYSQLFGFGVGRFHVIDHPSKVYLPYIGIGGGAMAATFAWKKLTGGSKLPSIEKRFCELGLVLGVIAFFCLVSFSTDQTVPAAVWFYVATACFGVNIAVWFANSEIVFSKVLTWQSDALGEKNLGTIVGLYALAGAVGRGFGPLLGGFAMQISERGGGGLNCDAIASQSWYNASATEACPVPPYYVDNFCCLSLTNFCTQGCVLRHASSFVIFALLVGLLLLPLNARYVHVLTPYEDTQSLTSKLLAHSRMYRESAAAGSELRDTPQGADAPHVADPFAVKVSTVGNGVIGVVIAIVCAAYIGHLGGRLDAVERPPPATKGYLFGGEPTTGPHMDVTQSALGVFAMPWHVPPVCMASRYFQDADKQLLRIDAGFPSDTQWSSAPGFMMCTSATGSVIISGAFPTGVSPQGEPTLGCWSDADGPAAEKWTYAKQTRAYGGANLRWLLNTTRQAMPAMAFAGTVRTAYSANGEESIVSYAQVQPPHLLIGWDVLATESSGLTRYLYHETAGTSAFDAHPGLADCAKFCGKTYRQAQALLADEGAPGVTSGRSVC